MASRQFIQKYEQREDGTFIRLELELRGPVPLEEIEKELVEVSVRHRLTDSSGGLFMVAAVVVDGDETRMMLGGMYVPPGQRDEVFSDLSQLGYEIIEQ